MSYEKRMAGALEHEKRVAKALKSHGWVVGSFGQGQLTEQVREAILQNDRKNRSQTPLRWLPDLITVDLVDHRTVFVDAKWSDRHDTPNHAIEKASLRCFDALYHALDTPTLLVWDDLTVNQHDELTERRGLRTGPQGRGSGTPYWLWPKKNTRPFDSYFMDLRETA